MKIKIVKNKYINALFVLMFFSALIHMAVLFFDAIKNLDIYALNYFKILNLDIIFPGITADTNTLNALSIILIILLYIFILKNNKLQ